MPRQRWINLELRDSKNKVLSRRAYVLSLPDGTRREGYVGEDGFVREPVAEDVTSASLLIAQRRFDLDLSGLPPIDTVEGAQERLNHLNYFTGDADGELGPFTEQAIRRFQASHGLEQTGRLDAATTTRLKEEHGV